MAALRFLSAVFLLIAVIALVADVTMWRQSGSYQPTSIASQWKALAPQSMQAAKASLTKSAPAFVWNTLIMGLISVPLYALFGIAAALAGYAGRRRHRINVIVN